MVGYAEWATRYRAAFSLNRAEDFDMLAEWERAFDRAGFVVEDLQAAANELLLNPPQTRGAHLKALAELCRRLKGDRARHRPAFASYNCNLCNNLGSIEAPHPAYMRKPDDFKSWRCVAIACMCDHGKGFPSLMNVEAFDRAYPNWREYMRERHDERLARMKLLDYRDDPDAMLEALVERYKIWRAEAAAEAVADASGMPPRPRAKGPPAGVGVEEWLKKQRGR